LGFNVPINDFIATLSPGKIMTPPERDVIRCTSTATYFWTFTNEQLQTRLEKYVNCMIITRGNL